MISESDQSFAASQISLNKKYGKRLVLIAWGIEILAASIGLFIGWYNASTTVAYYSDRPGAIIGSTFASVFIGAAPFAIIAAVELTKIPLVLGFYRTKILVWRSVFGITLLVLIFVTFETLFNGLESQYSAIESRISEPRRELRASEEELNIYSNELQDIKNNSLLVIDDNYLEREVELISNNQKQNDELLKEKQLKIDSIQTKIDVLTDNYNTIIDATGREQDVERISSQIDSLRAESFEEKKNINDNFNRQLENLDVRLTRIDNNESEELKDAFFTGSIRAAADKKRQAISLEKLKLRELFSKEISSLEKNLEAEIKPLKDELKIALEDKKKAEGSESKLLQINLDALRSEINRITGEYDSRQNDGAEGFKSKLEALNDQKNNTKTNQSIKEKNIPDLEEKINTEKLKIQNLSNIIREQASQNNVYRITAMFFNEDNFANLRKDQIKWVAYIWFGSLAFVAATVGSILALAGFVLQDPETYKPIKPKRRPIRRSIRRLLIVLRRSSNKKNRGSFYKALRNFLIDLRKRIRQPKIKYKKVSVEKIIEVEKVKEVPGPERVVYKEVPKEIIKKELVYVPFYSIEDGTLTTSSGEIIKPDFVKKEDD